MQGGVDKEVALSTRGDASQGRENEMRWYIFVSPPTAVHALARFCPPHNKRPLSDPDLSCNAQ